MAAADDWDVPVDEQPRRGDYAFDIDRALAAVVTLITGAQYWEQTRKALR